MIPLHSDRSLGEEAETAKLPRRCSIAFTEEALYHGSGNSVSYSRRQLDRYTQVPNQFSISAEDEESRMLSLLLGTLHAHFYPFEYKNW